MMIDLIENLKVIAAQSRPAEALVIQTAIDRIQELETRLSDYEEDITDWQISVEKQMGARKADK